MKRTVLTLTIAMLISVVSVSANDTEPIIPINYKVNVTKISKTNPFCLAIAKGDFETVKKLIELGTNVNEYSNEKTPLMYAARYNRVEIAKLLIANGAKIGKKDQKGHSALKYAELANAIDVAELIKEMKKKK